MTALSFRGNGTEYFKIWIVNILLTIITLGIYHPWAKVRTRRYFYGNTELDSGHFDYHATGKQLFLSYVIAMTIFVFYVLFSQSNPTASLALALLLVFAVPWIIWRSIRFNLRMTSYRNVRFDFKASLADSYATFLAFPIGILIAFALLIYLLMMGAQTQSAYGGSVVLIIISSLAMLLAYPTFIALMNKVTTSYTTNGIAFGQGQFSADLSFGTFFVITVKAMLVGGLLALIAMFAAGLLAGIFIGAEQFSNLGEQFKNMEQGVKADPLFLFSIFMMYALFIPVSMYVIAYLKARHRTYVMNETLLDNSISFESSLKANTYFGILLTNLLLIVFTAGLAYPWTAVRKYRYLIESTLVNAPDGFNDYMSKYYKDGAIGEELTDAFDIDVGGIAF
jgi:uncharacterized membrane protein YjgN (DUF898 family)